MDRSKRLERILAIGLALLATVSIGRAADEAYRSRAFSPNPCAERSGNRW